MNRLLGRGPELRQLLAVLARVDCGRSETIVIDGESGIGKTRLLSELATQAQALGWDVEHVEGSRSDAEVVLTDYSSRLGESGRNIPTVLTIPTELVTPTALVIPTVLIIDDAHCLNEAALTALVALAQRRNVSLMTVAAFGSAGEVVRGFRTELDMLRVPTITLSGLPDNASRELATAILGSDLTPEAASHLDIARGNPRLICELMRTVMAVGEDVADSGVSHRDPAGTASTPRPARHNLPLSLTPLIGRETEVAQLRKVLKSERLVTIAGAGGCGKTRLAIELAHQLLEDEMGRVLWIELALLSDGVECVSAVATALGVPQVSGKYLLAGILDALRARDVSFIVIDNAEHLIEATAALVTSILSSVSTVKMVCTSREPLGAPSEVVWRLPSLSCPLPNSDLAASAIKNCDAVRLFVDRATRVQRGFELTDENAPAIADICERLDGLPLAIELAAARMSLMAPERIAEQLNDRFRLLAGGSRTSVPRQQTLQASVAWSEELLEVQDRAVLRRLGVFVGGFTLEAAAEVVGSFRDIEHHDVSESLGRLVNKSLVNFDERRDRYSMLETIRAFALQRLIETNEIATARDVHAQWFAKWLESLNAFIHNGSMQDFVDRSGVMSRRIDIEQPNCYAAIGWVVPGCSLSLRLSGGLGYYWLLGQNGADAIRLSESALLCGDYQSSVWLDAALALSGVLGNAQNTVIAGLATKVSERAHESGDVCAILNSDYHSGWNLSVNGPTDRQLAIAGSQRQRAIELGDWYVLLNTTVMVSMSLAISGRLEESLGLLGGFEHHRTLLTQSACFRLSGDFGKAAALLGRVDAYIADLPSASGEILLQTMAAAELALLTQDESHLVERRFTGGSGSVYAGTVEFSRTMAIGLIHLIDRDLISARAAFTPRSETFSAGRSARWLCQVEAALGERKAARRTALGLIERWKTEVTPAYDASALLVLAECDMLTDLLGALDNAHRSLSVAADFGLRPAVVDALEAIGSMLLSAGRSRDAARLLGAASAARDTTGYRYRFAHRQTYVDVSHQQVRSDPGWNDGLRMTLSEAVSFAQRMRGERVRATSGWDSLTPTELRVVELVAIGLTNPTIADRLFMSRATVKTHLVHVYDKLSISTRAELASQATRRAVELN